MKYVLLVIILILNSSCKNQELKFNSEKWISDKIGHNNHRIKMTKNLIESKLLIGKNLESAIELLGEEYGYLDSNLKNKIAFTIKESYGFDIDPKFTQFLVVEFNEDTKEILNVKSTRSVDRRSFIEKILTE